MNILSNKKILVVICGGISAYKSLELIRGLKKKQVEIKTIITKSAKEFVTPLSKIPQGIIALYLSKSLLILIEKPW